MSIHPSWVTQGKTIRQLVKELQSFEDQDLEVQVSIDGGTTRKPISLVGKSNGVALLKNCESDSRAEGDQTESSCKFPERVLAQAICEIRLLLAGYLGSQNEAALDVRQAAHLAYSLHNVALGVVSGEAVNLSAAVHSVKALDEIFGSDYSNSVVSRARGV